MAPTATAPAPRAILQDRWDAVMDWNRTGGNSSPEYEALADALSTLASIVAGHCDHEIPDDNDLEGIAEIIVAAVEREGIAR